MIANLYVLCFLCFVFRGKPYIQLLLNLDDMEGFHLRHLSRKSNKTYSYALFYSHFFTLFFTPPIHLLHFTATLGRLTFLYTFFLYYTQRVY